MTDVFHFVLHTFLIATGVEWESSVLKCLKSGNYIQFLIAPQKTAHQDFGVYSNDNTYIILKHDLNENHSKIHYILI